MGYHCEKLENLQSCLGGDETFDLNMLEVKLLSLNCKCEQMPGKLRLN